MLHRLSDLGTLIGRSGSFCLARECRCRESRHDVLSIRQDALNVGQPFDNLTHVDLTLRPKKIEHWLRFGDPIEKTVTDKRRIQFGLTKRTAGVDNRSRP